jgi:hypothetical protein
VKVLAIAKEAMKEIRANIERRGSVPGLLDEDISD